MATGDIIGYSGCDWLVDPVSRLVLSCGRRKGLLCVGRACCRVIQQLWSSCQRIQNGVCTQVPKDSWLLSQQPAPYILIPRSIREGPPKRCVSRTCSSYVKGKLEAVEAPVFQLGMFVNCAASRGFSSESDSAPEEMLHFS